MTRWWPSSVLRAGRVSDGFSSWYGSPSLADKVVYEDYESECKISRVSAAAAASSFHGRENVF